MILIWIFNFANTKTCLVRRFPYEKMSSNLIKFRSNASNQSINILIDKFRFVSIESTRKKNYLFIKNIPFCVEDFIFFSFDHSRSFSIFWSTISTTTSFRELKKITYTHTLRTKKENPKSQSTTERNRDRIPKEKKKTPTKKKWYIKQEQ